MKRYLFLSLIVIPSFCFGQFKPFAGVEYFSNNEIVMRTYGQELKYDNGDISLIYGLKYDLKQLTLKTSAQTLMYADKLTSYTPATSEYKVSAIYRINNFSIQAEHMCLHPMQSYHDIRIKVFSGYTKVGVYWNMNP